MRYRFTWVALALLGLCPAVAIAQAGFDLSWGSCDVSSATTNQDFGCDRNDTSFPLVISFTSPTPFTKFVSIEYTLDIVGCGGTLPTWWRFDPAGCRSGQLQFPAPTTNLGPTCTMVPWRGSRGGGMMFVLGPEGQSNTLRILVDEWCTEPVELAAGVRYGAAVMRIDAAGSVDDGSGEPVCPGCTAPVAIVLRSLAVKSLLSEEYQTLQDAVTRGTVLWQGGATRSHPTTWGAIKALYR